MKLKSLELYGFKSFAEKSKLIFEKDISAIVGPNGSGKSNISDAIRWVLGEQSAKSLRGTNMHDVIFSGTDTKKQMNMASVSLTLDNRDKTLGIGFDDVNVTRKVYRTGESEYLLNNASVRLKDIRELFLDTGIGKDGYSIIGQGRIDEILSSKSEDRRVIFEEASGIAKFKYKKIESEKKLNKTQESLSALKNELKLKEQEVALLETQANNAKEGIKLTNELEKLELSLLKTNLDKLENEIIKFKADKNFIQESLDEKKLSCEKLTQRIAPFNQEIKDLSDKLESLKEDSNNKDKNINTFSAEINILNEKINFSRKNIERLNNDLSQRNEKFNNNKVKISESTLNLKGKKQLREKIDKDILDLEKSIFNKRDEKSALAKTLKDQMLEFSKLKEELNNLTILRNTKEKLDENNLLKKEEYSLNLKNIRNELDKNNQLLLKKEEEIANIDKKLSDNSNQISRLIEEREVSQKLLDDNTNLVQELKNTYFKNKSQRDLLYSVYKSYEGYYKPIQNLLKARDKNKDVQDKIFGVLADLIEVDKEYKQAIDVCLGGSLQNIVVKDESDAKYLIEYIKKYNLGRITFLPISKIRGNKNSIRHELVIDTLNNLIKYHPQIEGIIDHFLSKTLLVKNMDDAIIVSKEIKNFRIVTLDGDVINSWGSMVGGNINKKETHSLLNRKKELKKLDQTIFEIEVQGKKASQQLDLCKEKMSSILSELNMLDLDNNKYSTLKNTLSADKKELLLRIDYSNKSIEEIEIQIEKMNRELTKVNYDSTNELEKIVLDLESDINKKQESVDKLSDYLISSEKKLIKFQAEFESLVKDIKSLEDSIEELSFENDTIIKQNKICEEDISASKESETEAEEKINSLRNKINLYSQKLKDNNKELEATSKALEELMSKSKDDNTNIQKLKEEISELDKKLFQVDIKIDNNFNKKSEQIQNYCYSYDLNEEELISKLKNFEIVKSSKKEIMIIKNKLSKIGFFNFSSIEQYNLEFENLEFMRKQFDDLIETKEDIQDMIKKLESDMIRIFKESFKKINENFTRVFQILFDGGEAGLLLDGEDVLTAGIEIVAKPPGKKLKNIGLLSGGEKSLTAVALLFSIFEINPAPFCVLDEIDAALDEANIKRYLQYLRRLTDKTQFIIITHRKVTMEMAEILYGVTMEEKGISKVITLALDDYKGE